VAEGELLSVQDNVISKVVGKRFPPAIIFSFCPNRGKVVNDSGQQLKALA
jgi:hypothetical protein